MVYLYIFIGGGVGAALRYFLSQKIGSWALLGGFPLGIMAVNILGCLAAGIVAGLSSKHTSEIFLPLLMIGFLGGFTTFSAFSIEALQLIKSQKILYAGLYIGGSVIFSLLAAFIGFTLTKE